jgi:hypothetical protein
LSIIPPETGEPDLLKRLPNLQAILQVYAVIAVMISGWTITAFLWKISTWLLTLNLGEILSVFSYAMCANLVESLIVLVALLLACTLLPARTLRDEFAVRGTLLSIGWIGSLIVLLGSNREFGMESPFKLLMGPLVVLALTAILLAFSKSNAVHSAVLWISDRLVVFLFILMPLYIVLSGYVILRIAV